MIIMEIPVASIDVSQFNTRKNLEDGQQDSKIEDLAASIEAQGLINPIQAFKGPDGSFALVAGQRRLMAFKVLGRQTIPAVVLEDLSPVKATALSLTQNFHRAEMNPMDTAEGFKRLLDERGSIEAVANYTGASTSTIRKYVRLLNLAPELQQELAAGEAKSTQSLAQLAQRVPDPSSQLEAWQQIRGFTGQEQQAIVKQLQPDLSNLPMLRDPSPRGRVQHQSDPKLPI